MTRSKVRFSVFSLICLYSVFLIGAGFSRWLETDSGNILIHDITAESYEGFPYGARLFRPLQASSLNLRPSVLLVTGNIGDRYTCDHTAMEFARRGFVVLSIEDFGRGSTPPAPDYETENLVDAGFTFLVTRSFTDHERIGLVSYYSGAEKALAADNYDNFAAHAFISPDPDAAARIPAGEAIYIAGYDTTPDDQALRTAADNLHEIQTVNEGMLMDRSVIGSVMERFHEAMAIPNDSPFWFDAMSQRAQLLLAFRYILLLLLFITCSGFSALLTCGRDHKPLRMLSGLILPLILFLISGEIMNFFIVSVRLGSPFHYLPKLSQVLERFRPGLFLSILAAALISCISFGKQRGIRFVSDIISAIGILLCLGGFLPAVFSLRSGWELLGINGLRFGVCLMTVLFCLHSLMLRIPVSGKLPRACSACLTGIMFYVYCCGLPSGILFQSVL